MVKQISRLSLLLLACSVIFTSCKKTEITIPPEQAHFTNQTGGTYFLLTPTTTYKIPVGVTTVANVDRTYSFTVSSPTGATQGTHYTLSGTTFTIPAGKAVDSIEVKGVYAQYQAGRKDTLIFTMSNDKGVASTYNAEYKLLMRGPCFEGDVDLNEFLGTYAKTNELLGTSPYGPYTTTITSVTSTGPTSGQIVVNNIWDNGWGPITFNLDWSNPSARTAIVVAQPAISGSNAGDLNSAYAGLPIAVRPFSGRPGTFSICKGTLQLNMQLGVGDGSGGVLGYFGVLYQVNMAR